MMYANFLLVFLLSISSWSQGVSCDQIFQRLLMDQALSTGHQEHEVWLDFETVLRVHTIPQSHRPQFSLNAELLVPQQSLLQALLDVTDPNKHPSSQASYGLEILPRDTHRWFGQMGILQAITSVYPQSTTIHISAIEVLPKPTLQKLIVQIRFSLAGC